MDKDTIMKFAPAIVAIIAYCLSYNVFVTPAKLESTHREILNEVAREFARKSEAQSLQKQYETISLKIDKIYDYIMRKN